MTSTTDAAISFAAFQAQGAQRTVIDQRLTWQQRDAVTETLATLAKELGEARRPVHASAIADMAPLIVTCRDVETVAAWLDGMGKSGAAGASRTAFFAAALCLRQIVEV